MRSQIRVANRTMPGVCEVDPALLAAVVERVNRIDRERGLELARRIGTAILAAFFRNQGELFLAHAGSHVSFRSLASRPELEISYASLYRYTAVEVQVRGLPLEISTALCLTHHIALLPLRDPAEKLRFARCAVHHQWSSRALRAQIAAGRQASPRTGRPPLPAVLKASRGVRRALSLMRDLPDTELDVLDDADKASLIDDLHEVMARLTRVEARSR